MNIAPAEYWNHRHMYDDFWYVAAGYDKDSTADDVLETGWRMGLGIWSKAWAPCGMGFRR